MPCCTGHTACKGLQAWIEITYKRAWQGKGYKSNIGKPLHWHCQWSSKQTQRRETLWMKLRYICALKTRKVSCKPVARVRQYRKHREGAVQETWSASYAPVPFVLHAAHRGASQSAHNVPWAAASQTPHRVHPTRAECGDERPVPGAGRSSRSPWVAAGCTAEQWHRDAQMTPHWAGTPHTVPSMHLPDTPLTTEAARAHFLLQCKQWHVKLWQILKNTIFKA